MQQTQDIITIKTMKRLLKCLKTEPVEIYPGYSLGLTLPPNMMVACFFQLLRSIFLG